MKPGFRVRTTMTTGLSHSRAARQDQLNRLWDSKVITDPEVMADLMELPTPTFLAHRAADVRLARNENYTLAGGTPSNPTRGTTTPSTCASTTRSARPTSS
jgi:hypothetical protein